MDKRAELDLRLTKDILLNVQIGEALARSVFPKLLGFRLKHKEHWYTICFLLGSTAGPGFKFWQGRVFTKKI